MVRKYYCGICDSVDTFDHQTTREHFNWEEFATIEKQNRVRERSIDYDRIIFGKISKYFQQNLPENLKQNFK